VQTLLPADAEEPHRQGDDLYKYDGQTFAPEHTTGPAPEARLQSHPARHQRRTHSSTS
jgi:hypothetical protein